MSSESTIRNQMAVNKGLMDVEKAGNKVGDKRKLKQAANELAELLFVESHAALQRIIANNSQGVRNEHVYLGHTSGYEKIAMYRIQSSDSSGLRPCHSTLYLGIDGKLYTHDWTEQSTWRVLDPMAVYKDAMRSYKFFNNSMGFAMPGFEAARSAVERLRDIYPEPQLSAMSKLKAVAPRQASSVSLRLRFAALFSTQTKQRLRAIQRAEQGAGAPALVRGDAVSPRVHEVRGPADMLALETLYDGDIVRVIGQDLLVPLNVVGDGTVYVHVVGPGNTITHGATDHVQFAPFQADFTLEVL